MKLARRRLNQYQMKLGLPQESHPFDQITHHLFEIARQLKHQRMRKVPQAHVI